MNRDYTKKAETRAARIREGQKIADVGRAQNQPVTEYGVWLEMQRERDAELEWLRARVEELEASTQGLHDYWQAKDPVRQWGEDVVKLTLAHIDELEAYNLAVLEESCRYKTRGIVLRKALHEILSEWDFATDGEQSVAIDGARAILNTPVEPVYLPSTATIAPTGDTQGVGAGLSDLMEWDEGWEDGVAGSCQRIDKNATGREADAYREGWEMGRNRWEARVAPVPVHPAPNVTNAGGQ